MVVLDTAKLCIADMIIHINKAHSISLLAICPILNEGTLVECPDVKYIERLLSDKYKINNKDSFESISVIFKHWYVINSSKTLIKIKETWTH